MNAQWLGDILLGNFEALRQVHYGRYTAFNLQEPFAPTPHLVFNLLGKWGFTGASRVTGLPPPCIYRRHNRALSLPVVFLPCHSWSPSHTPFGHPAGRPHSFRVLSRRPGGRSQTEELPGHCRLVCSQ